jgi:transposase InsO family protein
MSGILLKPKEARRLSIIEALARGETDVACAAQLLGLSSRQVLRLKKRYRTLGTAALVHGNRGRAPLHKLPAKLCDHILHQVMTLYKGASCAFVSELLALETPAIHVSAKTIARLLKRAGVANPHTHRAPKKRRTRQRQPRAGLLVQLDASKHAWFGEEAGFFSLHGAIDDATSEILALHFRPTEDLHGYLQVLQTTILGHGIPVGVYHDRHTIFTSPLKNKLTVDEELAGKTVARTQFEQVLEDFDILSSCAHSPQAKGRVERMWQTLQERLVVWLRIKNIRTCAEANRRVPEFLQLFCRQFAVEAENQTSAFRNTPPAQQVLDLVTFRAARKSDSGSCISWNRCCYQLLDGNTVLRLRASTSVTVHTRLDGTSFAVYLGRKYGLQSTKKPTARVPEPVPPKPQQSRPQSATHPWKTAFSKKRRQEQARQQAQQ